MANEKSWLGVSALSCLVLGLSAEICSVFLTEHPRNDVPRFVLSLAALMLIGISAGLALAGRRQASNCLKPAVHRLHLNQGAGDSMNRFHGHGSIMFTASDGREYEIRHTADTSLVKLHVFRDSVPANRFCYTTTFETCDEFAFATGKNVIDQLIGRAKLDVERNIGLS